MISAQGGIILAAASAERVKEINFPSFSRINFPLISHTTLVTDKQGAAGKCRSGQKPRRRQDVRKEMDNKYNNSTNNSENCKNSQNNSQNSNQSKNQNNNQSKNQNNNQSKNQNNQNNNY